MKRNASDDPNRRGILWNALDAVIGGGRWHQPRRFKFSGTQSLHFDVLAKIQEELPGFPLVMHGSSSVPQDKVARINAAGGKLAGAKGVDAGQFRQAATLGVTKSI